MNSPPTQRKKKQQEQFQAKHKKNFTKVNNVKMKDDTLPVNWRSFIFTIP